MADTKSIESTHKVDIKTTSPSAHSAVNLQTTGVHWSALLEESLQKAAKIETVPVRTIVPKIFEVENKVWQYQTDAFFEAEIAYKKYVSRIINAVSAEFNLGDVAKPDNMKELAEAVKNVTEHDLFEFIADVFYKDVGAVYDKHELLITSLNTGQFNCYSSTVLLADVLERLGKQVSIVTVPGHVFLRGDWCALETTTTEGVLSEEALEKRYPNRQEWKKGDMRVLLSIAYEGCGWYVINSGGSCQLAVLEFMEQQYGEPQKTKSRWRNAGSGA